MRKRRAAKTAKEKKLAQQFAINLSQKRKELAQQFAIQLQNQRGGDPHNLLPSLESQIGGDPYNLLRSLKSQTPSSSNSIRQENHKGGEQNAQRFYGCYLLTSLSPRFKGHSYIGFTVNPKRRIRQHNGEISSGASQTKKKRPWEMVLCIHGFPSNVAALKFEWAWQNPKESVIVREAAASFKTLGGLANKIKLALTMLTLHSWQSMNLTVSFFSTKYMKHAAGCPSLPHQMKLHFCSMDELPCYRNDNRPNDHDDENDFDSNDNEIFANYSNDRLETSAGDSMETNLSSFHVQRCTVQNPSDNILAGDHTGTGGSLENESSSAMGVVEEYIQPMHQLPVDASGSSFMGDLEEHMQPMYQFPVDVSGSTRNTWNELFYPGEEFWIENDRGSFLDVEEHLQPIDGVNASEIEVLPASGEKQSFGHLSVDAPASTCNESEANEFKGYMDVNEEHIQPSQPFQQADPSEREQSTMIGFASVIEDAVNKDINEEHIQPSQPFQQADPLEREQSTMIGFASVIEDVANKDEISCIVIDDIAEEQYQSKRVRSPFRSVNPYGTFSTEGIEVIELCTPSPDFRITAGSKKKRLGSGFPDFIDLTRSPSFIQL